MLTAISKVVWFLAVVLWIYFGYCWFSKQAQADEWGIVQLEEVKIQYKSFFPGGSDPLITQNGLLNRGMDKELNLIMNTTLLDYWFLNTTVHSMTDKQINPNGRGQFRTVSLGFNLGLRLTSFLDISYAHRSEHLLDTVYSQGRFPTQDAIMFEFILFNKNRKESIINL